MAPTISASSKAVAASPRKKILGERNEVLPVTRSLEFIPRGEVALKPEMGAAGVVSSEGVGMDEEIGRKFEAGSGIQDILGTTELIKAKSEVENHKYIAVPSLLPSPIISPLVDEPSPPPYDPKTNYLSPRPRFLHYKPNPRFEQYRNQEAKFLDVGDGKQLEDSFSSESHEDTSGSTEEEQSSPLQQEDTSGSTEEAQSPALQQEDTSKGPDDTFGSTEEAQSSPLQQDTCKGQEDTSGSTEEAKSSPLQQMDTSGSTEVVQSSPLQQYDTSKGHEDTTGSIEEALSCPLQQEPEVEFSPIKEEAEEIKDGPHVSEPEFKPKPNSNHSKSRSLARFKVLPLLLVVIIASFYALLSYPPVISSSYSMLKNNGLANRLRDWSISSVAHLEIMTSLPRDELRSFDLANITFSAVDPAVDFNFIFSTSKFDLAHLENEIEQANEESIVEREVVKEEADTDYKVPVDVKTVVHPVEYQTESMKEVEQGESPLSHEALKEVEHEAESITMEVPEDVKEDVHPVEYESENAIEEDDMKEVKQEKSPSSHEALEEVEPEAERITMEVPEYVEEDVYIVGYESENTIEEDGMEEVKQEKSPSSHETLQEVVDKAENIALDVAAYVEDFHPVKCEIENTIEEDVMEEVKQEKSPFSHGTGILPTLFGDSLADSCNRLLSDIDLEDKFFMRTVFGITLGVVMLVATMVFLHMKQKLFSGSRKRYSHAKGSQNVPMSGDIAGYSSPSVASSSLHSSSSFRRQKMKRGNEEETMSNERRLRRDSTASSISYGSFTTYERLSAKKGFKDDDAATPVRRSSRIRNQVTSP